VTDELLDIPISYTIHLTREQAEHFLCGMMSDASEDCWCAGWLIDTENILPYICPRIIEGAGVDELGLWGLITIADATVMLALATALGHWVDMDGNPHTPSRTADI
jgi:hypothetical protein